MKNDFPGSCQSGFYGDVKEEYGRKGGAGYGQGQVAAPAQQPDECGDHHHKAENSRHSGLDKQSGCRKIGKISIQYRQIIFMRVP